MSWARSLRHHTFLAEVMVRVIRERIRVCTPCIVVSLLQSRHDHYVTRAGLSCISCQAVVEQGHVSTPANGVLRGNTGLS